MTKKQGQGAPDDASTVAQQRYRGSAPAEATFRLVVVEGPDRGLAIVVDGTQASRVLVGKSPACDVRLVDPEVSRRHAAFEIDGARLRVTDLGSTNGTYVDRVSIVEAHAEGGEDLRVGGTLLRVERGPAPADNRLPATTHFGRVVGWSREMRRLYPLCARLAASDVAVIVEGETVTGKEVLAESLHEQGPRASGPFVVFDCTAVPANLVESELFGHERGAFTGAVAQRRGVFEQAHGGTLLIDEIGDLDISLQPKLLRALERGEARRVGGDKTIRFDVRIMAATRRDLDREVQEGRFRDDLFHRLAVARVELPPLRSRKGDITLLAKHFARGLGGREASLSAELLNRWEASPWPGNVRELRNAVARHLALGELADQASRRPSADLVGDVLARRMPFAEARQAVIEEFERRYVDQVLAEHDGNVTRAAEASGVGRRYIHKIRARRKT